MDEVSFPNCQVHRFALLTASTYTQPRERQDTNEEARVALSDDAVQTNVGENTMEYHTSSTLISRVKITNILQETFSL